MSSNSYAISNGLTPEGLSIGMMKSAVQAFVEEVENEKKNPKDRFKDKDVGVERRGTKIILPSDPHPMRYCEAINALERREKEEETVISVFEEIDAFPLEGAYAFMKAMQRVFGWASPVPTKGFFGEDKPPVTVNLEIALGKHAQVLWGAFAIPNIEGELQTGTAEKDGRVIFCIKGKIKKKNQPEIAHLAQLTRDIVREESIYRGQAISLTTKDDGDIDFRNPPHFIDLSRVNPDELTFSQATEVEVQTNLFTPIEYTAACRMHKFPLKRGVLLEGPFGTGKTLTAFVTAQKAIANGWTFVMIDRVAGLEEALSFARRYQPAVVFAEDIDRAISGDERTVAIDDILNTIDGLESKGSEVITILTSNDAKSINRAMIRPGRLDAVISVQAPDIEAVKKLISIYGRGLLEKDTDLTQAAVELNGQIPAVIREVVERSKLYAINRAKSGKIKITGDDLTFSARGMKNHLSLLNGTPPPEQTLEERLGTTMTEIIQKGVKGNGLYGMAQKTRKIVGQMHERMS